MTVLAVCAALLVVKLLGLAFYVGRTRARLQLAANPEDARGGKKLQEVEPPEVARANRAHRNGLENIPPFLALAIIAAMVQVDPFLLSIAVGTFTAARFAHTFFHLSAIQPWRSVSHGLGGAMTIIVAGLTVFQVVS